MPAPAARRASPPAASPICSGFTGPAMVARHRLLVVAGRRPSGRAQRLRAGECTVALAGGVNLTLGTGTTTALEGLQMLSPDGRCKAFDASADGYVRGEGCGVVVLKRLADAEAATATACWR